MTTAVSSLGFAPSLACAAIESLGRKALAIQAASADPAAVTNAVETTARTFSGLNVLGNNARVWVTGEIDEVTVEEIDRVLAIHVRAAFIAATAAARHLPDGGRIAATVAHLAGDAGRFITGTVITVDGGVNA